MALDVLLCVAAGGLGPELQQFSDLLTGKGWETVGNISLCFQKSFSEQDSEESVSKMVEAEVNDAAFTADFSETDVAYLVSRTSPRLFTSPGSSPSKAG